MYWFAHDMGAAGPTPSLLKKGQRRIAANPELTAGMVRVPNHELRPSELFTPTSAAATVAAALRRGRGRRRAIGREMFETAESELRRRRATGVRTHTNMTVRKAMAH